MFRDDRKRKCRYEAIGCKLKKQKTNEIVCAGGFEMESEGFSELNRDVISAELIERLWSLAIVGKETSYTIRYPMDYWCR